MQVFAGDGVSGVLDNEGRLFSWGKRLTHGAALGNSPSVLGSPSQIPLPGKVLSASFGSKHGAAIVA